MGDPDFESTMGFTVLHKERLGNPNRGDDGFGQQLNTRLPNMEAS